MSDDYDRGWADGYAEVKQQNTQLREENKGLQQQLQTCTDNALVVVRELAHVRVENGELRRQNLDMLKTLETISAGLKRLSEEL